MLNKDQSQEVGNAATAIQAGGSVTIVNVGVTSTEARQIALDVAKATFYELTGSAKETASIRTEEITDQVIKKLEKEFPAGLQKAKDPDFQYALYTVQKEYARNGDKELGDLLVDLLVDRSKQDQRDILQIVLNESLATAPKLTNSQLAALALVFLFKHTQFDYISDHDIFGTHLDRYVLPFADKLPKTAASYKHLDFAGCGRILLGSTLEDLIGNTYQGLFLNGHSSEEISDRNISIGLDPKFFMRCFNDSTKLQVKALNKTSLNKLIEDKLLLPDDGAKVLNLFDERKMSPAQIKAKVIEIRSFMAQVFEAWTETAQSFTLTSVGIAIGHANIKRFTGEFGKLNIWIN